MSYPITGSVWKHFHPTNFPDSKYVLLALADRANKRGIAFPSHGLIAKDTCLSVSSVKRALKFLHAEKEFEMQTTGRGRNMRSRYNLKKYLDLAIQDELNRAKLNPKNGVNLNPFKMTLSSNCSEEWGQNELLTSKENQSCAQPSNKPSENTVMPAMNRERLMNDEDFQKSFYEQHLSSGQLNEKLIQDFGFQDELFNDIPVWRKYSIAHVLYIGYSGKIPQDIQDKMNELNSRLPSLSEQINQLVNSL